MNKLVLTCIVGIISLSTYAQNLKTQVVVLGNSGAAAASAYQAALSGVKTVLVLGAQDFDVQKSLTQTNSGFEDILKQRLMREHNENEALWTNDELNKTLSLWADSLTNLNVVKDNKWTKVDKSGNGWQVRLADGKNIKAGVLILGVQESFGTVYTYEPYKASEALSYENTRYRTSISGFLEAGKAKIITLDNLLSKDHENLVLVNADQGNMTLGQAAGIVAAYGQFFGVKTAQTKIKGAQGEALAYKQELLPVSDIAGDDKNWRAIQNILQTGILKLEQTESGTLFNPQQAVTIQEIDVPARAYFYKAQLWFEDHANQDLSIEKAIHLITYTRNKSFEHTLAEVEKKWQSAYHFETAFDKSRVITRREFAAISLDYFQLDQVNVDKDGTVLR